jgi:hypothetical protein
VVRMAARPSLGSADARSRIRRGILLTLPVGPLVAALFALVYGLSPDLWPLAIVVISPLGTGLLTGLAARVALPDRRGLAWIVAVSSSCLGLIFLGWLSGGAMGLEPRSLPAPRIAWGGLLALTMAGAGAWLSTHAWKRAATSEPLPTPTPPVVLEPAPHPRAQRPTRRRPATRMGQALSHWRRRWERQPRRVSLPNLADRIPRRRLRHLGVRVGRLAEERCPYCLDLVLPGDARGIHRCEVCHTAHHADCWAQTGTCQVLHHHG